MTKKSLPIVSAPTLTLELPVSKIKVKYRPFVIKEQKALLLAQESKEVESVTETIKSVVLSCSNGTVDPSKIPAADLAYFFIHLRIASVGPEVKFQMPCVSCNETNVIGMSLNDIKVSNTVAEKTIQITDTVGITFRVPTIEDVSADSSTVDRSIEMLYRLIVNVYDEDQLYDKSDYTEQEFRDWIETFNDDQLLKIKEFVDNLPELKHDLEFECVHCNHKQRRTLEGLHSFFRADDGA